MFQALVNGIVLKFRSKTTGSGSDLEHTPYKFIENLPEALVGGRLDVNVGASALPTGAASESTLATVATTLASIASGIATAVTRLTEIRDANIITDAFIDSIAAVDTNAHAFASQAVKAPVQVKIDKGMTGTLTIDDGDAGAVVLSWDDTAQHHQPEAFFYVANLSQLRYTFSVSAGGNQRFAVSTAI